MLTEKNTLTENDVSYLKENKQSLGLFAGLLMLLIAAGGLLIWQIESKDDGKQELLMGVFIVTAIISLMTLLYIMAAGFKLLNLTNRDQPLGLPEGSIRAMIALILIIAFIIFGIYLFRSVGDGVTSTLENKISADSLKKVNFNKYKDFQTSIQTDERNRYDSALQKEVTDTLYSIISVKKTSDDGNKLAQQLVTTVGTLVVAISSFYFGSTTVANAMRPSSAGTTTPETPSVPAPVPVLPTVPVLPKPADPEPIDPEPIAP